MSRFMRVEVLLFFFFFFQAEDGIRDYKVTGVQTCALPIFFLHDALLDWFVQVCGEQVRRRGEILLDIDSTDDPTYGHQQLSFFNGAYNQHMYHPLLIFERHTGCLLAARLRRGTAARPAPPLPLLVPLVLPLQKE